MPDQPPLAAQLVAPVEVQVRVDAVPLVTLAGLALIVTVAARAVVTLSESVMPSSIASRRAWSGIRFGKVSSLKIIVTNLCDFCCAIYATKAAVSKQISDQHQPSRSMHPLCGLGEE